MTDEANKMLREIRDLLAELNLGVGALIGEKQVRRGEWVPIDSLKSATTQHVFSCAFKKCRKRLRDAVYGAKKKETKP